MLTQLNKIEELKAITILSQHREEYSVTHYVYDFFGMKIPVCDIVTNNKELEREIMSELFPQFD